VLGKEGNITSYQRVSLSQLHDILNDHVSWIDSPDEIVPLNVLMRRVLKTNSPNTPFNLRAAALKLFGMVTGSFILFSLSFWLTVLVIKYFQSYWGAGPLAFYIIFLGSTWVTLLMLSFSPFDMEDMFLGGGGVMLGLVLFWVILMYPVTFGLLC
jgi:hypothetical protein